MLRDILVVNGSPMRRHASRELLERAGYKAREILSLEDALKSARQSRPLAIVVEEPDDAEVSVRFTQRLRRHPTTQDVPVLVLTSDASKACEREDLPAASWLHETCSAQGLLEELAYLTRPPIGVRTGSGTPSAAEQCRR